MEVTSNTYFRWPTEVTSFSRGVTLFRRAWWAQSSTWRRTSWAATTWTCSNRSASSARACTAAKTPRARDTSSPCWVRWPGWRFLRMTTTVWSTCWTTTSALSRSGTARSCPWCWWTEPTASVPATAPRSPTTTPGTWWPTSRGWWTGTSPRTWYGATPPSWGECCLFCRGHAGEGETWSIDFVYELTHSRSRNTHKSVTFSKFLMHFLPFKGLKFHTFSGGTCPGPS